MKNKKTYYLLILDRSGSMNDCLNQTISGFNEQVQMIIGLQQRFPDQQFLISLTTFNSSIEHPINLSQPQSVIPLSRENYVPDGCTALLDAIGEGVMNLKAKIQNELVNDQATAVVVILTDGYENASVLFDWQTIRKLILELEATNLWTFSFLGATKDALETASRMNIRQQNAAHFKINEIQQTFSKVAESLSDYAYQKSKDMKPKNFFKNKS